jgi:hypothetical protein
MYNIDPLHLPAGAQAWVCSPCDLETKQRRPLLKYLEPALYDDKGNLAGMPRLSLLGEMLISTVRIHMMNVKLTEGGFSVVN